MIARSLRAGFPRGGGRVGLAVGRASGGRAAVHPRFQLAPRAPSYRLLLISGHGLLADDATAVSVVIGEGAKRFVDFDIRAVSVHFAELEAEALPRETIEGSVALIANSGVAPALFEVAEPPAVGWV